MPRNQGSRRRRLDRALRLGAARPVRPPASLEGALDRKGGEQRVPRHAGARRRRAHRAPYHRGRSRRAARRPTTRVRRTRTNGPARDGRHAAAPAVGDDDGVIYYRTLDDYRRLREIAGDGVRVAVIGGGFIGSEVAAALASNGCAVTIVFPDTGIGARLFPAELASYVNDYYREKGVTVLADQLVESVAAGSVTTKDGTTIEAEAIVAGLGIVPVTDLAEAPGWRSTTGSWSTSAAVRADATDVFAAGDVARFPVAALGGTRRVEHEDHANTHGRDVGANMAGADAPYDHLPFFYSDLFELGYEAVGDVDSRLETVDEWAEPNRQGRRRLRRRRRQAARVPALGRVGQGRLGARAHPCRNSRRAADLMPSSTDALPNHATTARARGRRRRRTRSRHRSGGCLRQAEARARTAPRSRFRAPCRTAGARSRR